MFNSDQILHIEKLLKDYEFKSNSKNVARTDLRKTSIQLDKISQLFERNIHLLETKNLLVEHFSNLSEILVTRFVIPVDDKLTFGYSIILYDLQDKYDKSRKGNVFISLVNSCNNPKSSILWSASLRFEIPYVSNLRKYRKEKGIRQIVSATLMMGYDVEIPSSCETCNKIDLNEFVIEKTEIGNRSILDLKKGISLRMAKKIRDSYIKGDSKVKLLNYRDRYSLDIESNH